jgi:hypothetical protein
MSSFDSLGLKICLFVFLQKLDSKKNNYDQLIDKFRGSSTLLIDKHEFLITSPAQHHINALRLEIHKHPQQYNRQQQQ